MKKGALSIIMTILVMLATGCSLSPNQTAEEINAAIIVGNAQNTARADLSDMESYALAICKSYGYVSLISLEGEPAQAGKLDIAEPTKNLSASKLEARARSYAADVLSMASQIRAQTEEADVLSSIQLGARAISTQKGGEKYLIIFHSGISTKGEIDFTKMNLDMMEIDAIISRLKENAELPDLSGVHVVWHMMGDTVEPQKELSAREKQKLKDIWSAVLKESGAKSIEFKTDLPTIAEVDKTLPNVTPIQVLTTSAEVQKEDYVYDADDELYFDERSVQFQKNSAQLLTSIEELDSLIDDLIAYMREHREYQILLCGTTAKWGSEESSIKLSYERANAIKDILVKEGVNENQVIVKGLGWNHEFHMKDIDDAGNLIEEQAKLNRAVIILNWESERARRLMKEG